jgi:hypothetical protein
MSSKIEIYSYNDFYNYVNNNLIGIVVIMTIIILLYIYFSNKNNVNMSNSNTNNENNPNNYFLPSPPSYSSTSSPSSSSSSSPYSLSSPNYLKYNNNFNIYNITKIIVIILIGTFIILFVLNVLGYFVINDENENIIRINKEEKQEPNLEFQNILGDKNIIFKKQVFNIPKNKYTYNEANALCKALDSRLANYSELEEAYRQGGEWCNYGWSSNQMALFPTQKKTWEKLQKIKGHENDCGRPGINGGYIANKDIHFGVNCYGYKPRIRQKEEELMSSQPLYPRTKEDIEMEKRVDYWKNHLDEILISPFNKNIWNKN